MERLKQHTILIGRDPVKGSLLVSVEGIMGYTNLGAPRSVPSSVSRCIPASGAAHARISVDDSGEFTIENAKPQNETFVNDNPIVKKRIKLHDRVALGRDRYSVDLHSVISAATKIISAAPESAKAKQPQKFNISHLELVWNGLQDARKQIQAKQKKVNLVRSGCGLFTMCAMPCCFLFGPIGYVLTGIGFIGNVYSFVGLKNDNTSEALEKITEHFQDHYVCPNPDCNKFLGNLSYKLLKRQYSMHCPHCKCEFVEK